MAFYGVCVVAFVVMLTVCSEGISDSTKFFERLSLPGYASNRQRSRQRRQTADNSDFCATVLAKALCDTSYAKHYINDISKCGNRAGADINDIESYCRKNSAGDYCGEALTNVNTNCISTSSCSAGCFNSLQRAGCCLNSGDNIYSGYLTNCRIPTPSPCPKSKLRLPTLRSDTSCDTDAEFVDTVFTAHCDNVDPVVRALRREKTCRDTAEYYEIYCSSRNGQYCYVQLNLTRGVGSSLGILALQEAVRQCPSDLNCSLACNSSLNFVQTTVGCCIHAANDSSFSYYPGSSRILSSPQWDRCGVPFPQKCDAVSLKMSNLFVAAAIIFWIYIWPSTSL